MMPIRRVFVNNDEVAIKSDGQVDELQLVARNVRRFRTECGMSLGELARRSGLSKQTLSVIEQGAGNPTVETLSLLGAALGLPARRLLTEYGTSVYVQRDEQGKWAAGESGRWDRHLDETLGSGYVRTTLLRMERAGASAATEISAQAPGTLHHVYVIAGRLRVGPVNDPVEVLAGDFVRFPGDVAHVFACLTDRATAHVVTTIPQVRHFGPIVTSG